jgi:membrane-bound serine protease (ClpP class)
MLLVNDGETCHILISPARLYQGPGPDAEANMNFDLVRVFLATAWAAAFMAAPTPLRAEQVGLIHIDGAIGPATATYISRALDVAAADHDECLIIQLDTPGGLLESTKEIVRNLLQDREPSIVYVAPAGAGAASAGTFITLAADIAAMAPATTIGAAHPVTLGAEVATNSIEGQKLENYAVSWIDTIATERHHNVDWAKSAVRASASITATEALKLRVIDLIASDVPDLLQQLDGKQAAGKTLRTAKASVVEIPMTAGERLFQMLWRPEVMFVLMLVAIYGIIGELSHPGAILPGVAGAVALVLALYMGSVLPVNAAGLALMLLAVALFIIDVFAATHGVLTVGGVLAFLLGSLLLFNRTPGFSLPLTWIIPATILTALFFLFVIGAGLRAQFQPAKTGRESMKGKTATALTAIDQNGGKVLFDGEYWEAVGQEPVAAGAPVEIIGLDKLVLRVKPKS